MTTIKTIGSSGQISLGKEYAGQTVLVDEIEHGIWIIKLGQFIPDSERWFHETKASETIKKALEWDQTHDRKETNVDELERRILGDGDSTRSEQ